MIPKIIHYCWLSKDPLPVEAMECIKSWKKHLPDYEIKLWNMNSLDVQSIPFMREAVQARKWAFAADYVRVYALYHEGGIYLDSDVFVKKNFDFALENRAFSAIESYPELIREIKEHNLVDECGVKTDASILIHGIQIQAAILGSEKHHPFFKDCLDYYNSHHFVLTNGQLDTVHISPIIMSEIAISYGFKFLDKPQDLADGLKLYSREVFAPQPWFATDRTVAIHCCNGSWRKSNSVFSNIVENSKIHFKKLMASLGIWKNDRLERMKNN